MIILGIDPGSTRVGYGVIETQGNKLHHVASGLLRIGNSPADAFREIEKNLEEIIREKKPVRMGIEKLFFVRNQKTGIRVAEARGVILNTASKMGLEIQEFSPSEIKLAVSGSGNASKRGVAKMVRYFIKLPEEKMIDDVSDALAVAIAASRSHLNR